jgi:uncharacterized protein YigA (DUF484 family)
MDHTQVAQFLTTNPHFFEEHAELLGTIKLSSPLLGRAISLQERQMEIMRDKYRHLELRLAELLHLAHENDNTIVKFQRWTNSLLLAQKDIDLPRLLTTNLQEFFSLPHASLRLWNVADEYKDAWFANSTSEDVQLFARGLPAPFCGENKDFEAASWIDAPVTSLAMLPLRLNGIVIGLMVLGSPEKNRYTSNMETLFLTQIADTTSAALSYLVNKL